MARPILPPKAGLRQTASRKKQPGKLPPANRHGGLLGVAGMATVADYPAADPITAIAVGIVSGLAATGIDQIAKQAAETE